MGQVSEPDFRTIVEEVAAEKLLMSKLIDYSVGDFWVALTYQSNSGKQKWEAHLNFDKETFQCQIVRPYSGSGGPSNFAYEVQTRVEKLAGR